MPFVRVRGASVGDPLHEFDVSTAEAAANPNMYTVLDPKPVATARPASFVPGVVKRAAKKRPAKRAGETDKTAPAGADS